MRGGGGGGGGGQIWSVVDSCCRISADGTQMPSMHDLSHLHDHSNLDANVHQSNTLIESQICKIEERQGASLSSLPVSDAGQTPSNSVPIQ